MMLVSNEVPANVKATTKVTFEDILAGCEALEALELNHRLWELPWRPEDSLLTSDIDLHDPISLRVYYPFVMGYA